MDKTYWHVKPEWKMQTAYIIGGGPSVRDLDVSLLKGRNVITVNSSYAITPWAPILFFGDLRWWRNHKARVEATFPGRIVTTSAKAEGDRLLKLKKVNPPPGVCLKIYEAAMQRTSAQAAANLAYHLGSRRLVLLGLDNRDGPDGRPSHHEPHPWPRKKDTWVAKLAQLALMAADFKTLGVEVLNASPISTLPFWSKVKLEDTL